MKLDLSQNKECQCKHCKIYSPLFKRIVSNLSEEDKLLFDDYITGHMIDSEDLGVAEAKLAGDWPDWEFLPKLIKDFQSSGISIDDYINSKNVRPL